MEDWGLGGIAQPTKPESHWSKVWPPVVSIIAAVGAIIGNQLLGFNPWLQYGLVTALICIAILLCVRPIIATVHEMSGWLHARKVRKTAALGLEEAICALAVELKTLKEVFVGQKDFSFEKIGRDTRLLLGWENMYLRTTFDYLDTALKLGDVSALHAVGNSINSMENFISNRLNNLESHYLNEAKLPREEGMALFAKNYQGFSKFKTEYNHVMGNIRTIYTKYDNKWSPDYFRFLVLPELASVQGTKS